MEQYYIIRILGKGSEGQVLLCEHKETHEEVAIKRMEYTDVGDANVHLNEANKMKKLNHKNILKLKRVFLHKYSSETHFVCLAMEYAPNGDLFKYIERERQKHSLNNLIPEDTILRIMFEICDGLHYLHENSIIHRDLKPQNILLSADNTIRICDFGFSRELGQNSVLAHTMVGTPNYMSWEILNGRPYDEKVDMYSIGIILLQMMTGKSMMLSIELSKDPKFYEHLMEELCERSGYSKQLVHLAQCLLQEDPKKRLSAKECMQFIRRLQMFKKRELAQQPDLVTFLQGQNEESTELVLPNLKHFFLLAKELQCNIMYYLDLYDAYMIMQSGKYFKDLVDTKWFFHFCSQTSLGKEIMSVTEKGKLQVTGSQLYKEKVRLYYRLFKPQRAKLMNQTGKHFVQEILLDQLEAAARFATDFLQRNYPEIISILQLSHIKIKQTQQLHTMLLCLIRYGMKYGRCYVCLQYNEMKEKDILGLSIWLNPYQYEKIRLKKLLRSGFSQTLQYISLYKVIKLFKWIQQMETFHDQVLSRQNQAHWTLLFLAVKTECQRKGIGASLLLPALRLADESSLPIYAQVFNSSSVDLIKFYKRYGFDVMKSVPSNRDWPEFSALIRFAL